MEEALKRCCPVKDTRVEKNGRRQTMNPTTRNKMLVHKKFQQVEYKKRYKQAIKEAINCSAPPRPTGVGWWWGWGRIPLAICSRGI